MAVITSAVVVNTISKLVVESALVEKVVEVESWVLVNAEASAVVVVVRDANEKSPISSIRTATVLGESLDKTYCRILPP